MLNNIALLSQSSTIAQPEVMTVAAALQKQVLRDFNRFWNVAATIDSFATLEDVPTGYWPVIIVDEIASGEMGIHGQRDNQPIAMVQAKDDWSLTASHEMLEMLADPFANRLVAGDSIAGDGVRVEYLVEICDPCQDAAFGYRINGILVSDFYTPQYFDASGTTGAQYDFVGRISQPRTVLEGGYLSWRDPDTNHLHRADMINSELFLSDLGEMPATRVSLRSYVDSLPPVLSRRRLPKPARESRRVVNRSRHKRASMAKAKRLRAQLVSLRGSGGGQ